MTEKNENNILFFFDEDNDEDNNEDKIDSEVNISLLFDELDKIESQNSQDVYIPRIIDYNENYTVKELLLICDYYGITKEMKLNKLKKEQIILFLVNFESNTNNTDIVCKRQNMWFYMNELKNDKFMKKYVLW